eukprot:CAMPEP_0196571682 /NCGR_PEP_ID=MMETSP1081-20130531/1826_1 /TAXON_ID=36882 /ORGANISM="Pyramimonas amylifera, Strain CCMP720" /LENGTH=345 /DNA_ID=CAMNT_0041888715 /DNA_START=72 /DNA_END=1109 /DNA_ORIENTATION=-
MFCHAKTLAILFLVAAGCPPGSSAGWFFHNFHVGSDVGGNSASAISQSPSIVAVGSPRNANSGGISQPTETSRPSPELFGSTPAAAMSFFSAAPKQHSFNIFAALKNTSSFSFNSSGPPNTGPPNSGPPNFELQRTSSIPGLGFFDVEKFGNTSVTRKPFVHMVVEHFVPKESLARVNADFPPLLTKNKHMEESELIKRKEIFGEFKKLLDDTRGVALRDLISSKFLVNLKGTYPRITLRGFCNPCEGKIHVDAVRKAMTVLIYLNEVAWEGDGGNLKLLTGPRIKDAVSQVPSYEGNLLVFRNAKHAWHGFTHYAGPRRAIQLNYEVPELRNKNRQRKGVTNKG